MDPIQLEILNLLRTHAVGSANAMNADQIFNMLITLHIPVIHGRTQEHIRASVRSMIKDHGQLIGSKSGFGTNNGYYIINNRDEAIDTIMDLVGRSRSMLERVEALKHSWNIHNTTNQI